MVAFRRYCDNTARVLLIILVVSSVYAAVECARPLEEVWWSDEVAELLLQALPRGPVQPSGPSGCTHSPNNPGHCP